MKKVLYLTNIEVPYRVRFFNELAKYCDLTVLYERETSGNRNNTWAKSEKAAHTVRYLNGIKIKNENSFSFRIFKEIFSGYDRIIVGCYNSPVQIMAIAAMRLLRIPYFLNLDGEPFLEGNGIKKIGKRFVVSGAEAYLAAGEQAAQSLKKAIGEDKRITPYYFSSLTEQEILAHRMQAESCSRSDTVLVVGQYEDYKGMDVALAAARLDSTIPYKFVGMGSKTEQFQAEHDVPENVEIVPFLQKKELEEAYRTCRMLVLPSRQECWGLVINEAASFGMPIVSTWGSGAAVEFLSEAYPQYLAQVSDGEDLLRRIRSLRDSDMQDAYSKFLLEKSKDYTIERNALMHENVLALTGN